MPYVNLIIAQAVSDWVAAPFFAGLIREFVTDGIDPYFYYAIAVLGAVIVWVTGLVGARISKAINPPNLLTLATTLLGALAGTYLAFQVFAPHVEDSQAMAELFLATPVVTAILGYMLHPGGARAAA